MHKYIKNIVLSFLLSLGFFWVGTAFAQGIPDAFVVEVEPSSFGVNENVDLTIKAVTNNGETVKDYDGDVFIEVDGIIDPDDYVVPSDGLYTFLPQDQGVKLFSKGLNVKVPGTYSILVSDIIDENIQGKITVIVGDTQDTEKKDISIITPIVGSVQTQEPIELIGKVPELPNSNYQVYLNKLKVLDGTTSPNGDISTYLSGSLQGENKVQVKVVDINGEVIGESSQIAYTYQSSTDSIFQKIDILPGTITKQGDKLTFNIDTSDEVSSVELNLSDGNSLPMDRVTAGKFTKQVLMELDGEFSVSLSLMVAGNRKIYTDVASYTVQENIGIGPIKVFTDSPDKTSINVIWDRIGQVEQYRIEYGVSENSLSQSQNVTTNEVLIENLDPDTTYYFRISPLDADGNLRGTPSSIQEVTPGLLGGETHAGAGASCIVNGIHVYTTKIGGKYYLNWDPVENAVKYMIYRSDFENTNISNMQKVGETTAVRFEYPFNNMSTSDQYAYYAVQATCSDGSSVQVDNVQRVHVGPMDNFLLFLAFVLFAYVGYRLYVHVREV